jgi:glycine/D-amino acid oxidase-like deaminating enzyme
MHYDLALESALAWRAFPTFTDWADVVGEGDCGFVRTGFMQLVPAAHVDALRANVAAQQALGIATLVVGADEVADLVPGMVVDDVVAAAWEPLSGYADPTGTAAGLLAAARRHGATYAGGVRVERILADAGRVTGVETDRGTVSAPVVVDAAGAWAGSIAATAGVDVPIQPWRHDTGYFGLPAERPGPPGRLVPIVLDHIRAVYFRSEGRELLLVGLETGNEIGGSPDRPVDGYDPSIVPVLAERVCERLPWMADGDFRTAHGGQDGMSPDQRAILGPVGPAGPEGLYLQCGFSGSGFKTAPAVGEGMAAWILDGAPGPIDLRPFGLGRFARGELLEGEHPYESLWR